MEQQPKDMEEAVLEMATMFRQYGYRNRFSIMIPLFDLPKFTGNLNDCLYRFLAATLRIADRNMPGFEMETRLPYNDKILCHFKMDFDRTKGFLIRSLEVNDRVSKSKLEFRFRDNRELPGMQTIHGLFPKPKPWDFLKKGKFRP